VRSIRAAQKLPALRQLSCGENQAADDRDTTLLQVSTPVAAKSFRHGQFFWRCTSFEYALPTGREEWSIT